jgi:PAS domain-containing protein
MPSRTEKYTAQRTLVWSEHPIDSDRLHTPRHSRDTRKLRTGFTRKFSGAGGPRRNGKHHELCKIQVRRLTRPAVRGDRALDEEAICDPPVGAGGAIAGHVPTTGAISQGSVCAAPVHEDDTPSRDVLDSMTDAIATLDRDGNVLFTNPAWKESQTSGPAGPRPHRCQLPVPLRAWRPGLRLGTGPERHPRGSGRGVAAIPPRVHSFRGWTGGAGTASWSRRCAGRWAVRSWSAPTPPARRRPSGRSGPSAGSCTPSTRASGGRWPASSTTISPSSSPPPPSTFRCCCRD